jgi:hypothetical protein
MPGRATCRWESTYQSPGSPLPPILIRWCSRHSRQTQPRTYAAFVPCSRSSRRIAFKAASSSVAQSSSVLVSPHTWLDVSPKSRIAILNGCLRRWRPETASTARVVAALVPCVGTVPWLRRSGLAASGAATSLVPPCRGALCRLWAASSIMRIGKLPHLRMTS